MSQNPKRFDLDDLTPTPIIVERNSNVLFTPIKMDARKNNDMLPTMSWGNSSLKNEEIFMKHEAFLDYLGKGDISPLIRPVKIKVLNFGNEEDDKSESIPFSFDWKVKLILRI